MTDAIDKDVIPINWSVPPTPYEIQLSLAPLDEIGIPYDKRGLRLTVPKNQDEWQAFATAISIQVEKTIIVILEAGKNV